MQAILSVLQVKDVSRNFCLRVPLWIQVTDEILKLNPRGRLCETMAATGRRGDLDKSLKTVNEC